jgi:hypothetical protein
MFGATKGLVGAAASAGTGRPGGPRFVPVRPELEVEWDQEAVLRMKRSLRFVWVTQLSARRW